MLEHSLLAVSYEQTPSLDLSERSDFSCTSKTGLKKQDFRKQVLKFLQHHQKSERLYMNVEVVAVDMLTVVTTSNKRHLKQF